MSDSNHRPSEVSGLMVLFVAGMSGAGRSSANILEDDGWYVADNVPSSLVAKLVDFVHTDSRRSPGWGSWCGPPTVRSTTNSRRCAASWPTPG